jgi:hypothetical protein
MDLISRGWLIRFTATLALLYAGCVAAPRFLRDYPQFLTVTGDAMQVDALDRYFKLPQLDIVITGSSLAWHLKDWYFARGDVRNAALAGGTPLTALAIIAAAPSRRPRAIAVETNVLDRSRDEKLHEMFKDAKRPLPPLPPMRTLAAWYEGARVEPVPYSAARIQSIVASPPGPDRSSRSADALWADWNRPLNRGVLLEHAQQVKALAEKLESQGVRVFFFEMPYASRLKDSLFAKTTHDVFAEVIAPDDKRRLDVKYSLDDMRSLDGVHLDARSAVVFAAALDAAIREKLGQH